MKQLLSLLIVAICIFTGVKAQHIPDANFAKALHEKYPDCIDEKDNLLPAASSITDLEIDNYGIKNLSGIMGFSKLATLNLWQDSLIELPELPGTLLYLACPNNNLTHINKLPNTLFSLSCRGNPITQISNLPTSLKYLDCGNNKLDSLPILPVNLGSLNCSGNKLTVLPALPETISDLNCSGNQLAVLPKLPDDLEEFWCDNNLLTKLPDLPKKLHIFHCGDNKLVSLPALPENLYYIYCQNNNFSICPEFSTNLMGINISNNKIKHLSNIPSTVTELTCDVDKIDNVPIYSSAMTINDASGTKRNKEAQTEPVKEETVTTTTTTKNYLVVDTRSYEVHEFGNYQNEYSIHGWIVSADAKISVDDVRSRANFYAEGSVISFNEGGYKDKVVFDDCSDENGDCTQTYQKYINRANKEQSTVNVSQLGYIIYK